MSRPKVLITWPLKSATIERFSKDIDFICLSGNDDVYNETIKLLPEMDGLMVLGFVDVNEALIDAGIKL